MLYNFVGKPNYIQTAGKITIAAAVSGLLIFAFVFLFNAGKTELLRVEAQTASTTLTVLNTPPQWLAFTVEQFESSTSTPTNSGSQVSWIALAENSGNAPYFLLVCSTSATPTANAAASSTVLGSAPPTCNGGVTWGVSTATVASTQARVATTTTEVSPFTEVNNWFSWVCDDDPVNPRCNDTYSVGLNATNSSPFHVNFRPDFTNFYSDSPANPGESITFYSTSTDPDIVGGEDTLRLFVCNEADFSTTTVSCGAGGTIATTTVPVTANATASFSLPVVIQDDIYDAFGYIVDQHGHTAVGGQQGLNEGFEVSNVAPTVNSGDITLNGTSSMTLSVPAGQTTGFTLNFTTSDANSCLSASSTATTSEMIGYTVALSRGSATTTCTGLAGSYNPNSCYPSGVATTTWNLACTASSTSCSNATDPTVTWSCSFPLWFVADPTDSSSPYYLDDWVAKVAGVDDDYATGTATVGSGAKTLISFPAIDLLSEEIPYGSLEPGDNSGTLTATTSILSVGNTGLNQSLQGSSMCPGYSVGSPCNSAASSSTIPEYHQEFATSSLSYGSGLDLSSSTPILLRLQVPKTSSTTNPNSGVTYWGIGVPLQITVAGAYTGLNTFYAITSASSTWGI
jgi:hypothetical protein